MNHLAHEPVEQVRATTTTASTDSLVCSEVSVASGPMEMEAL